MTCVVQGVKLGVYEKALAWTGSWSRLFASAMRAGFSFVDLSVDETPQRVARLGWSSAERAKVRAAAAEHGIELGGLCLSIHRKIAPGSADRATRQRAVDVLVDAIDLCCDLGIPVLQLAGYFAYYEPSHPDGRKYYVDVMRTGARHAARRGVMLGIENVDGSGVTSISSAVEVAHEIGSAWVRLYPDVGNLAERSLDVVAELAAGEGQMLAIHVKDVRPNEPRRIPMGGGTVPWERAFAELSRQRWSGKMLIEMWNDDSEHAETIAREAREFIERHLTAAGIAVVRPQQAGESPYATVGR